jgi:hypothetical protein
MEGYIKGSVGPFITVQDYGYIVSYMQRYSLGSLGPFITVHVNGPYNFLVWKALSCHNSILA